MLISCLFIVLCRLCKDGRVIPTDKSLDYAANFYHMLGFDDPKVLETDEAFCCCPQVTLPC